jgi:hypothetical protein
MHESDTYLMILDEGEAKGLRRAILIIGEKRIGLAEEDIKAQLNNVSDLERLERMAGRAATASS